MDTIAELVRCGFEVEQNEGWVCVRRVEPFYFVAKQPGMPQLREAIPGPRGYQILSLVEQGTLQIDISTRAVRSDLAARVTGNFVQRIGAMIGFDGSAGRSGRPA